MKKNNIIYKFVSLLVTGIFLFQQISWAAGDVAELKHFRSNDVTKYEFNTDLAEVDIFGLEGQNGTIINIQDDHSSLSGQYSIVEVLTKLLNDYRIDLVAVEGGSGYIDTSILRSFPDPTIKEETASYLMKEGKLSAGEFFAVMAKEDIALYGVEDDDLYQKNLLLFRDIYESNTHLRVKLEDALKVLAICESDTYSEDLAKFVFKSGYLTV